MEYEREWKMENKTHNDELNYKQAYYYLFNQITNIITWLKFAQGNAETICVDLIPEEKINKDTAQMLEKLIKSIKEDIDVEDDN